MTTSVQIYGIKNCDTMKKAFRWLDRQNISYDFHDYKKSGVDAALIGRAIDKHGWENVINRKGTTWRNLPDSVKDNMTAAKALGAVRENPSLIRRPMLTCNGDILLGFDEDSYSAALNDAS